MRKGFTLIELVTVIIVIAVLTALALPQYTRMIERAQVTKAKSKLDSVRKAEGIYYSLKTNFTTSLTDLSGEVPEIATGLTGTSDGEWAYSIAVGADITTYTATATRVTGKANAGTTIILNNLGVVSGTHPLK